MAGWDEILKEFKEKVNSGEVRRQYLKKLSEYTGRNVIAYYSGFFDKPYAPNVEINDSDMTGFMNALHGMDCRKGLDLILHTPGGSPTAAEAIIYYLRAKFKKDIRVIVPQLALSVGTMMACAANVIIMGKHSSLGPVDPQFNGIPAYNIKMEFEEAKSDLAKNPQNQMYWIIKLHKYPAAFLKTAIDAIELSDILLRDWLGTCMFDCESESDVINEIVAKLNEHDDSKVHGRHFNIDFCKSIGLKIEALEKDPILQDAVLSVHHAYMLTFSTSDIVKIIESQNDKAVITRPNKNVGWNNTQVQGNYNEIDETYKKLGINNSDVKPNNKLDTGEL